MPSVAEQKQHIKKKFLLLFKFYDSDGDGFLSTQDFEHRERVVGYQSGLNEQQVAEYIKKMKPFYDEVIGCNKEDFAERISEIILKRPEVHEAALRAKSEALFRILDRNRNGTLEPHEFAFLLHTWLLHEREKVEELFELSDRQRQNKLSPADFYFFQSQLIHSPTPNRISEIILQHLQHLPKKIEEDAAKQQREAAKSKRSGRCLSAARRARAAHPPTSDVSGRRCRGSSSRSQSTQRVRQ